MKSASLLLVYCLIATGFAASVPQPPVFLGYQDSLGQYSFGYSAPGSARSEVRTSNGATRGAYSYVDETGVIQTAQYVADDDGFRVVATNLPQAPLPVQDTPEVMAARYEHLQALEQARRTNEEIQNREKQENAQERRIEENQSNTNIDRNQNQLILESAETPLKEEREKVKNETSIESNKDNEETLQAVASRSGVAKEDEKPQDDVREESFGRVTQEIIGDPNIRAIPLISSHGGLPVFRISYGSSEIEPPVIPQSSITQGASGVITPASTVLKSGTILQRQAATPEKQQQTQPVSDEQTRNVNTLISPLTVIPLSYSQSSVIGYAPPAAPLHYVTYNVL